MLKPLQKPIIAMLLITSSIAYAENSTFYVIVQGGAEIKRELDHSFSTQTEMESSEWQNVSVQTGSIIQQVDKALLRDLYNALSQVQIRKLKIPVLQTGLGYRFNLLLPLAFECTLLLKNSDKRWDIPQKPNANCLFLNMALKTLIPISSKNKLHIQAAKLFSMNQNAVLNSSTDMDLQLIWSDFKETVLHTTPMEQWDNSMTLLGVGISRLVSSKIESVFSVNGYTKSEDSKLYFNACLGMNYLFS